MPRIECPLRTLYRPTTETEGGERKAHPFLRVPVLSGTVAAATSDRWRRRSATRSLLPLMRRSLPVRDRRHRGRWREPRRRPHRTAALLAAEQPWCPADSGVPPKVVGSVVGVGVVVPRAAKTQSVSGGSGPSSPSSLPSGRRCLCCCRCDGRQQQDTTEGDAVGDDFRDGW